jgi:hypothetical protein
MFALVMKMCYMFFEHLSCAFPDSKLKVTNQNMWNNNILRKYFLNSILCLEECGSGRVNNSAR